MNLPITVQAGQRLVSLTQWVTDVRTVISVTDTQRNAVRTYINPQGTPFQPIQDTSAFATCP